jgi:phage protein D
MPFGTPIVDIELIDYDQGDEVNNEGVAERVSDYLQNRLMSLKFSDHVRKRDKLELTLRNDDYRLFEYPAFARGQKLRVTWGWPGRMGAPRRMVVRKVKGGDVISVTAHCVSIMLDRKRHARFMEGVTDSEFVRKVAAEHGYTGTLVHIEETTTRHDITQLRQMTDARMLRRLAQRNGFEFYIDATGLHWHKRPTDRAPVRTLHYRTDPGQGRILDAPRIDADLSKGVAKVRVLARDPIRKVAVDESVGITDEQDVSLGKDDELFDPDDPSMGLRAARISTEEVFSGGLMTAAEAKAFAAGRYRETAVARYKMSFMIIGDAQIAAKQIIAVYGMTEVVDGLYFVKEAITEITPGTFHMSLKCEKDALPKVTASKKNKRKNVNEEDEKETREWTPELKKMITPLVKEDGQIVPGYIYTEDEGYTGHTSQMTSEDFDQLSERQKRNLYEQGVNTSYPDP